VADISTYIRDIELASRGEEVRDAIIYALNAINEAALGVFDETPTNNSTNAVTSRGIKNALDAKQDVLTFDDEPTENSGNPVKSGGLYSALQNIQQALTFDDVPTEGSDNPVKSGGIYNAIANIDIGIDEEPTEGSSHAVSSGGVYDGLAAKQDALTFDDVPIHDSNNPVKSKGIYNSIKGLHRTILASSVTLGTTWSGNDPYTQIVTISGATAWSKVDIQPDDEVLAQLISDGVRAIWIENDDGVFTAHAIGGVNTESVTLQCTLEDTTTSMSVAVVNDIILFPDDELPTVVDDILLF